MANVFGRQKATKKRKEIASKKEEEQFPSTSAAPSNFDGNHQNGPQPKPSNVQWERVLYKRQPFPDNHTDEQFLDQLRTNVNVVQYSLLEAIRGAATVMGQADLVVLFMVIFEWTQLGIWGSGTLLFINLGTATFLLTLFICLSNFGCFLPNKLNGGGANWVEHFRTLVTILAFGYAFTPIIRTLTTSISTDTIWVSALLLFFASLIVHDYGLEDAPIASTPLSVNLCLAASVFLISRLKSDFPAFLLLGLSLLLFCFWPPLRNALLSRWPNANFWLFPPLAFSSIWALTVLFREEGREQNGENLQLHLAFFLTILHLFVCLFCPFLLIRMQKMKSTIHGPWDEVCLRKEE